MSIHPTAVVSEDASLGENVILGPFAIVEEGTIVGDECVIDAAAQVRRGSRIEEGCRVGSGAIVGADPHFRGFDPATPSGVRIGPRNVLREYVTVHRSIEENGETVLGEENFLMNGAHVGHDCLVGNGNTLANNATLGGHVEMANHCFLGGTSTFHQFVRIGDFVMTQGLSGFSLDLPPYVLAAGINEVAGLNTVGLRRGGFGAAAREQIKRAFREVYRESHPLKEVLDRPEEEELLPEAAAFFDFLRKESKKGVCRRFRRPQKEG